MFHVLSGVIVIRLHMGNPEKQGKRHKMSPDLRVFQRGCIHFLDRWMYLTQCTKYKTQKTRN